MKNKGLIKFVAWLFGLVCVFQLLLTFQFNRVEDRADNYAISLVEESEENFDTKRRDAKLRYVDSISNIPVFNILIADYTYDELKKRSMKLGLDLSKKKEDQLKNILEIRANLSFGEELFLKDKLIER